jgi:hypothetical protein
MWIQWVTKGTTCKKDGKYFLLKMKSLRTLEIAQSKATHPLECGFYLSLKVHLANYQTD